MSTESIDTLTQTIIDWVIQDRKEEELDPLDIAADSRLLDEEIFDSLKILQFVAWLEQEYQLTIGVELLTTEFFASPRSIAEHVVALQAKA